MKSKREIKELVKEITSIERSLKINFDPALLTQIEELVKDLSIEDLLELDTEIQNFMISVGQM